MSRQLQQEPSSSFNATMAAGAGGQWLPPPPPPPPPPFFGPHELLVLLVAILLVVAIHIATLWVWRRRGDNNNNNGCCPIIIVTTTPPEQENENHKNKTADRNNGTADNDIDDSWTPLIMEYGTKFVLQVLGGAGAIWGSSEILQLRTNRYQSSEILWRWIAIIMGFVFFGIWCRQLLAAIVQHKIRRQRRQSPHNNVDESSPLI